MKKPESEEALWALSYSIAASLLTLGHSLHSGVSTNSRTVAGDIDSQAAAIADAAAKRLKGKLP